jgi:hypothetical protein
LGDAFWNLARLQNPFFACKSAPSMTGREYASVPERITWTTGFRQPVDKYVLGVLSTFANFRTGQRADMSLHTLVTRAKLERRRVIRSLRRLIDDGWITAERRHRRPTIYHINIDRLATHWMEAKVVAPLSDTRVTQDVSSSSGLSDTGVTQEPVLSDTGVTQGIGLSDTGVTQEPVLSDTGVTPSPVRTDPLYDEELIPGTVDPQYKQTALRAAPARADTTTPTTPEAKVELPARDPPSQLTFGPLDVSPDDARWQAHWERVKVITENVLQQATPREKQHRRGG